MRFVEISCETGRHGAHAPLRKLRSLGVDWRVGA